MLIQIKILEHKVFNGTRCGLRHGPKQPSSDAELVMVRRLAGARGMLALGEAQPPGIRLTKGVLRRPERAAVQSRLGVSRRDSDPLWPHGVETG